MRYDIALLVLTEVVPWLSGLEVWNLIGESVQRSWVRNSDGQKKAVIV
jgi:hypothetical protein